MKRFLQGTIFIAMILSLALSVAPRAEDKAKPQMSYATGPCQKGERWSYSEKLKEMLSAEAFDDFEGMLSKKITPVQGLADALAVRNNAESGEVKSLAEYWMARSLLDSGLIHIAQQGFSALVAHGHFPGIQIAALGCLARMNASQPSLEIADAVAQRLPELALASKEINRSEAVWSVAGIELRELLSENKLDKERIARALVALKDGGQFESVARGWVASRDYKHAKAVEHYEAAFKAGAFPPALERYEDITHILMGRALFSMARFDQAAWHLKQVKKSSNELAGSLSELSWAYLMDEKYAEAIGTAMSLQAGGLRNTFTPEAQMVMAMALNEICQFPESVRAIQSFRKNYGPAFEWLQARQGSLYRHAIDHLRKKGEVPQIVASEWVRSPLFIASQGELNLLIDEKELAGKLSSSGSNEQKKLAAAMMELLKDLKPRFKIAVSRRKEGQSLGGDIIRDLKTLRKQLISFHRLRRAAPIWKSVLANHLRRGSEIEGRLMARIDSDLERRTHEMDGRLAEIAENIQLIEVEIYNGASQDIIWQNAHPEYKKVAQQIKDEKERSRDMVLDWGRAPAGSDEAAEIWEDELGSFKANLFDNCSSKDKFLALRIKLKGARK